VSGQNSPEWVGLTVAAGKQKKPQALQSVSPDKGRQPAGLPFVARRNGAVARAEEKIIHYQQRLLLLAYPAKSHHSWFHQ